MSNALFRVISKLLPGAKAPLASDINQFVDMFNGSLDAGILPLAAQISAPSAATATAVSGTTLGIGAYIYKISYITGNLQSDNTYTISGETSGSASVSVTTTSGNQAVTISGLPAVASWPVTAIGIRLYRTAVGGADGTQKLVTTLITNYARTSSQTSYTDTTADSALGATVPTSNSTGTDIAGFTADPTQAPTGLTGTLKQFISWIANRINAITGTTFTSTPRTTLANAVKLDGDAMSGSLAAPKFIANEGTGASNGYTFNEAGSDTGMYSHADGDLRLYSNNVDVLDITSSGATLNVPLTYGGYTMPQLRYINGYPEWNNNGTWQGVGGMKNVQRGITTMPANGAFTDVTVTSVNMAKAFCTMPTIKTAGVNSGQGSAMDLMIQLLNATTVRISNNGGYSGGAVSWEVVESY